MKILEFEDFVFNMGGNSDRNEENNYENDELNTIKKYVDYLRETLDKSIHYSNYIATKFDKIHEYLNTKNNNEFSDFCRMVEEGKSETEINALFRKNKIKNILK